MPDRHDRHSLARGAKGWLIAAPAAAALVLAGCSSAAVVEAASDTTATDTTATVTTTGDATQSAADVLAQNQEAHDSPDDASTTADSVAIELDGASASVSSDDVTIDGSTVTITAAGTYVLSGDLDGQLVVDSVGDGTVRVVLDGVDIANADGAAIDIRAADEAVVVLADGSTNTLSDADAYADDADANAALHSSADLTITGTGSLEVTGNGNDGITSTDGLVIQSGTIAVTAVDDGIRGKDYVVVRGGDITIEAGGDGVKSDNETDADRGYILVEDGTVDIVSGDEGLDAFTDVVTTGGAVDIVAGGGADAGKDAGAKGISAGVIAVLEGGDVSIDSGDDGVNTDAYAHLAGASVTISSGDDAVHAELQLVVSAGDITVQRAVEGYEAGQITISGGASDLTTSDDGVNVSEPDTGTADLTLLISGGTLTIDAGGDGLDVNQGGITQTGGDVVVHGPTDNGNGALDADGGMEISGGTLLAVGSSGMAMAPAATSAQASVQFALAGSLPAGTVLTIQDAAGTALASLALEKTAQNVVYSAPGLVNGETYTLVAAGTAVTAVAGEQTSSGMGGPGGGGQRGGGQRP